MKNKRIKKKLKKKLQQIQKPHDERDASFDSNQADCDAVNQNVLSYQQSDDEEGVQTVELGPGTNKASAAPTMGKKGAASSPAAMKGGGTGSKGLGGTPKGTASKGLGSTTPAKGTASKGLGSTTPAEIRPGNMG